MSGEKFRQHGDPPGVLRNGLRSVSLVGPSPCTNTCAHTHKQTSKKLILQLACMACPLLRGIQQTTCGSSDRNIKIGVAQIVFLVNRICVPCQKGAFDEDGENDEFAFYPLKRGASLLRHPKTTKMAGVTQAKAWFRKNRFVLP